MAKEVKDQEVVETDAPETTAPATEVKAATMSDLSMLRHEAANKGRTGDGTGIMGKFKDRLLSILDEAVKEAGPGGEVAPLPCGAVVRFFLKNTDIFNELSKDDRYNRAYRYLAQAKKAMNRSGWDIDKIGKENFCIYTGKSA